MRQTDKTVWIVILNLELMVAKDYWTTEDMTDVNAAITAGNGYTAD